MTAPLCSEADYRDTLDDGAFWDYVLLGHRPEIALQEKLLAEVTA